MSHEQIYHSIILKKQPYNEADEIITLYTLELGKIRVLAKSSKAAKSKLQHALQSLFLVEITVAGSKDFPKVIGAEIKQPFSALRENLDAVKQAFYAVELALKFSPDEQVNRPMFFLLQDFFEFLDKHKNLPFGLAKFKIMLLEALGLGLSLEQVALLEVKDLFMTLKKSSFVSVANLSAPVESLNLLQRQLSDFIGYQLEREVKSEKFMEM